MSETVEDWVMVELAELTSRLTDDPSTFDTELLRDRRSTLRLNPNERHATVFCIREDFGSSSSASRRLAVPQPNDSVGAIHHLSASPLVGLLARLKPRGWVRRLRCTPEEMSELIPRGLGLEIG